MPGVNGDPQSSVAPHGDAARDRDQVVPRHRCLGWPVLVWQRGSATRGAGECPGLCGPARGRAGARVGRGALPAPPTPAAAGNHAEKVAELGNFGVL